MVNGLKKYLILGALVIQCVQPCVGFSQPTSGQDSGTSSIPDLVVLPFANNTLDSRVHEALEIPLLDNLQAEGLTVLSSQDIRPFLRKHRIRSRGWIGLKAAGLLARETGAKFALLGSWDVFRTEGNPEVGFSMRVLDLEHMALVAAMSVGVTGEDHVGAFETGRISHIQTLVARTMQKAISEMFPLPEYLVPRLSWRGCFQVALIPLNNYSDIQYAGDTLSNILLTQLLENGFSVLEPGFVRELGIEREVVNRGGIDDPSAGALFAEYGVCRIITGSVERLETARGDPGVTFPRVSLGLRVMDPRNGRVYMMKELVGQGDQNDGFFQLGRTHSLMTLSGNLLAGFAKELQEANREDIIHVNR